MPSSKDPTVNRRKAREYALAHPEWKRASNRDYMRRKRSRLGAEGRADQSRREKERDPVGYLLQHAGARARQQGIAFDLVREDLVMPEVCPVLGLPFKWGVGQMGWRNMWSPSLDRIKPQIGYVRGNVRVISNRANHLKSNGTINEFEAVLAYMIREGANRDLAEQHAEKPQDAVAAPQLELVGW